MKSAAEAREERIRESAYHIWEANGRPSGRDEDFWHRACEMIAADNDQPNSRARKRQREQTQPVQRARSRRRQVSPPATAEVSAPAG